MKNKKNIYILLPIVALIWGLVIYKLVADDEGGDFNDYVPQFDVPNKEVGVTDENFQLELDYRDPFLGNIVKQVPTYSSSNNNESSSKTISVRKQAKSISQPFIKWPLIQIGGMVNDRVLVEIEQRKITMKSGEEKFGVTLTKMTSDSLYFEFKGQEKRFSFMR